MSGPVQEDKYLLQTSGNIFSDFIKSQILLKKSIICIKSSVLVREFIILYKIICFTKRMYHFYKIIGFTKRIYHFFIKSSVLLNKFIIFYKIIGFTKRIFHFFINSSVLLRQFIIFMKSSVLLREFIIFMKSSVLLSKFTKTSPYRKTTFIFFSRFYAFLYFLVSILGLFIKINDVFEKVVSFGPLWAPTRTIGDSTRDSWGNVCSVSFQIVPPTNTYTYKKLAFLMW